MRKRALLSTGLAMIVALSCSSEVLDAYVSPELEAYCAVATRADLVSWVGGVVTLCEQGEMDHHGACTAGRLVDGAIEPIELADGLALRVALPASRGRLLVLLADERLVLIDRGGAIERVLDRWAADPGISEDGERVAWIGIPDGFDLAEVGLGTPKVVAVQSLSENARTVLVEDNMASAPRPIPGSSEVLYVSGNEEGIAGFFLVGPGRGATQITNVGIVDADEELDPVAGSPSLWASNGSFFYGVTGLESVEEPIDDADADPPPDDDLENGELVDDAELEVSHLFRLVIVDDVATVEEVGEGGWPQLDGDGAVLAALPLGSAPCATTYATDGAP